MLHRTVQDVAKDLHVPVGMSREAAPGGDSILVDHPERTEAHVIRIVVFAEAEGMGGL